MGSGSRYRRDRSSSSSRSRSPERSRRRRRRYSSSSSSPDDRHRRRDSRERRHRRRRRDRSSGRSREKERRERRRSRSRSGGRQRKRDRDHRRESRSRSPERSDYKKKTTEKRTKLDSKTKDENPAEALKAKVKAMLDKTSEASGHPIEEEVVEGPTPGQISIIESNSFTADKFVSKRSSKKWDIPPSGVPQKKKGSSAALKSFDVRTVDPSEFVPKVVPMNEVESALGREGEEVEFGGEGERSIVSIKDNDKKSSEAEPLDRNQKWLQKLKKMRDKLTSTNSPKN